MWALGKLIISYLLYFTIIVYRRSQVQDVSGRASDTKNTCQSRCRAWSTVVTPKQGDTETLSIYL